LASKYGSKPTVVENMSAAIAWCAAVYVLAAALIGVAVFARSRRPL
jgi:hypothetical protein